MVFTPDESFLLSDEDTNLVFGISENRISNILFDNKRLNHIFFYI